MGKRKHKDSQDYLRRKIRKLEKRLRRYSSEDSDDCKLFTISYFIFGVLVLQSLILILKNLI